MIYGVVFEVNTGKILRCVCVSPDNLIQQAGLNEKAIVADKEVVDTLYYVDNDLCKLRPTQATICDKASIVANGIDSAVFTNTPDGLFSAIRLRNESEPFNSQDPEQSISGVINGTDTFLTTIAGAYKIRIQAFPYLDFEATIEAI